MKKENKLEKVLNKDLPICFHRLEEMKYKSYFKAVECDFYQTSHYDVSKFYKPIANL